MYVLSTMKLPGLFLLLALAFDEAQSESSSQGKVVCVKEDQVLDVLNGREGPLGQPGIKGDKGIRGDSGMPGDPGEVGLPGRDGMKGFKGLKGNRGRKGIKGWKGWKGEVGEQGTSGERGFDGLEGDTGLPGKQGKEGQKGEPGLPGLPGTQVKDHILLSLLNDYYVMENGYYNNLYHVTSRVLTDGRGDTGGWGSKTSKPGNYIQATYARPVYVTSVTIAGGYIPSWRYNTTKLHGSMDLEYSYDEKSWNKIANLEIPDGGEKMITHQLSVPVTAQYWRLISTENKMVGTTEFALKPLIKP